MNLATELLNRMADPNVTHNERTRLRCHLSKELEASGNYEAARAVMADIWKRIGERPALDSLDEETTAEVLLQVGVLTSCIGSAKQFDHAQEIAKDLISESVTIFKTLGKTEKVAEAETNIAICYWRQGEYEEARLILKQVLDSLADTDSEVKAVALIRGAIVEWAAKRFSDALRLLTEARPQIEKSSNDALKGKYFNQLATLFENLSRLENRADYLDRALIEYAAASFHFEQAGHERYCARVENNLGFLFATIGKFTEAYDHVGRARRIFVRLRDSGSIAQVDDTYAKVLLAEGRNAEANQVARSAVQTLQGGGEQSLLAEALITYGIALARVEHHALARQTLERVIQIARQAGDHESAGQAALTIIEELSDHNTPEELGTVYERANEFLSDVQYPTMAARLILCARKVLSKFAARPQLPNHIEESFKWEGFSLRDETLRFERLLIERALKEANGHITQASRLLGFSHHGTLTTIINSRHKDLMKLRMPVVPRKQSIITKRQPRRKKS